jgi:DNA-binding CsgD family transcriptional regulator
LDAKARGVRLDRPATLQKRCSEVLKLKAEGKDIREIARQLKMPVASVFKLVKQAA